MRPIYDAWVRDLGPVIWCRSSVPAGHSELLRRCSRRPACRLTGLSETWDLCVTSVATRHLAPSTIKNDVSDEPR